MATYLIGACVDRSDTGFNPAAGAELRVTPAELPADGSTYAQIDIWIRDGDGNPQSGVDVILKASGPASIKQPTAPTDAAGHTVARLASDVPGLLTLGVQASIARVAVRTPATAQVRLTPAEASVGNRLSLSVSPAVASVDVATRRSVVARLVSSAGTPVANAHVALASSRSGDVLSPSRGLTTDDGTFSATFISSQAGVAQLSASGAGAAAAQTAVSLLTGAPDAAHTFFLTQLGNVVLADGVGSGAEVFVGDQYGNPVSFAPVSIASSAQNVTLVPPSGIADGQGIFHTSVAATDLGSAAIVVSVGSTISQQGVQLVVGPPSAATSVLSVTPTTLVADGVSICSLTARLTDAAGHPRVGDVISWASTDVNDVFASASGVTDSSGAVQTQVHSTHASAVTLYARAPNLTLMTGATFEAGPPSLAQSSLMVTPAPCVASSTPQVTLTAQLRDAQGNPVPGESIQWAASDNTVIFGQPATPTDASGQAVVTLTASRSGNVVFAAEFGASTLTSPLTVLPASLSLSHSALTISPATLVANGNAHATLTLAARDIYNNAIAQEAITLSSGGVTATFSALSGNSDTQGLFVSDISGTQAGTLSVTATLGAQALSAPLSLVAGPISGTQSTLVLSPNTATADGQAAIEVVVTLADAFGNPIAGQATAFAASGGNDTLAPPSGVTDGNGQLATSWTSTQAATQTLVVQAGNFTTSAQAVFVAGSPNAALSSLTVSPNLSVAGGNVAVTLSLQDAFGNPTPGLTATLSGGSNVTLLNPLSATDASGQIVAALTTTLAQNVELQMTSGAVTLTAPWRVLPGPASLANCALALTPNQLVAGGSLQAVISLVDAYGNPLQNVAVSAGSLPGVGVVTGYSPTNTAGQSSAVLQATLAQNATLTAQAANVSLGAMLRVVAGAPSAALSGITVTPNTIIAGSTPSIALFVNDGYGNPVANQSALGQVVLGGNAVLGPNVPWMLDANGLAYPSGPMCIAAGNYLVTAGIGNIVLSTPFSVQPNAPVAPQSFLAISGLGIADNQNGARLSGHFVDAYNNVIASQNVSLSSTINRSFMARYSAQSHAYVTTYINGVAQKNTVYIRTGNQSNWQFSSPQLNAAWQNYKQSAAFLAANNQIQVIVTNAGINLDSWTISSGDSVSTFEAETLSFGGATSVASTKSGFYGSGYAFLPGSSNSSITANFFNPASAGNLLFRYRYNANVNDTIQIVVNGNIQANFMSEVDTNWWNSPQIDVYAQAGNNSISIVAQNSNLLIDQIAVTFPGIYQNVEAESGTFTGSGQIATTYPGFSGSGYVGSLLMPNSSSTVTLPLASESLPPSTVTDSNGSFSIAYNSGVAEIKSVQASLGNFALTANVLFVAGQPSLRTSRLITSSPFVTAGQPMRLAANLQDVSKNAVSGSTASFFSTGLSGTFVPSSATTSGNGIVYTNFLSTLSGQGQLCAQIANAFTLCQNVQIQPGPPSQQNSYIAISGNLVADGLNGAVISGHFADSYGNPISGQNVVIGGIVLRSYMARYSTTSHSTVSQMLNSSTLPTMTYVSTGSQANWQYSAPQTNDQWYNLQLGSFLVGNNSLKTWVIASGINLDHMIISSGDTEQVFEAETLAIGGNAIVQNTKLLYTGSGYVNLVDSSSSITLQFFQPASASNVLLRHRYNTGANSNLIITLNGNTISNFVAGVNSSWWNAPQIQIFANSGNNTMTLQAQNTAILIDQIAIRTPGIAQRFEAEGGTYTGGASVQTTYPGYTGTGYVGPLSSVSTVSTLSIPMVSETIASSSVQTDSSGNFLSAWNSTIAEQKTVVATMSNLTLSMNIQLTAGNLSASSTQIILGTPTPTAGQAMTVALAAHDIYNNAVSGFNVSFSANSPNVVFFPSTAALSSNGLAFVSFSSTLAGPSSLCAQVANQISSCQNFIVRPASPNAQRSSFGISPNALIAGGNANIAVQLVDAFGNPVTNQTLSLAGGTNITMLSGFTATDASGRSAARIQSNAAQVASLQVVAGAASFPVPLIVLPGSMSAANSGFVSQSIPGIAGSPNGVNVVFHAADMYGNAVPNQSVVLSPTVQRYLGQRYGSNNGPIQNTNVFLNGPMLTSYPNLSAANNWNTWTFAPEILVTLQMNNTLTIVSNGNPTNVDYMSLASQQVFQSVEAESATSLYYGAVVANSIAGYNGSGYVSLPTGAVALSSALILNYNAPIASPNAVLMFRYSTPQGGRIAVSVNGNELAPLSLNATNAMNPWQFTSGYVSSVLQGNNAITVINNAGSTVFYIDQLIVSRKGVTQLVQAEAGTLSGGATIGTSWAGYSGSGYVDFHAVANATLALNFNLLSETLSSVSGVTDASGNFVLSWGSRAVEPKIVTATAANAVFSQNVVFVAAAANATLSSLAVIPPKAITGSPVQVVAQFFDSYGNPLAGQTVVVQGGNVFSAQATNVVLDGLGVASVSLPTQGPQSATVSAQWGNTILSVPLTVVGNPSPAYSWVAINANTAVANGSANLLLSGHMADGSGNPLANETVNLAVQGNRFVSMRYANGSSTNRDSNYSVNGIVQPTMVTFPGTTSWNVFFQSMPQALAMPITGSVLTFFDNTAVLNADSFTLSVGDTRAAVELEQGSLASGATVGNANAGFFGTGYVSFPGGGAASASVNYLQSPAAPNVSVGVRYQSNTSQNILLIANGLGANISLYATLSSTDWQYSALFPVSLAAGNNLISLSAPNSAALVDQLIIVQRGPNQLIEAEAGRLGGRADVSTQYAGYTGSGFVENLCSPLSTLNISYNSGSETLSNLAPVTDASGNFVVSWSSLVSEAKVINAAVGNLTYSLPAQFVAGPPVAAKSRIVPNTQSTVIAGQSVVFGLQAVDANANPVGGAPVAFSASNNALLSLQNTTTNSLGLATVTLYTTSSGVTSTCASMGNVFSLCANTTVVAGAPNASLSTFAASSNSLVAGANVTLTGILLDGLANPCAGQNVSIVLQPNTFLPFGPFAATTNAGGQLTLTVPTAAAANFTAILTPSSGSISTSFAVSANATAKLLIRSIRSIPSGLNNDAQVVGVDGVGNPSFPFYNGTVSFSSSDFNAILPPSYTFVPGDMSAHFFPGLLQLFAQGNQTVTVTDVANPNFSAVTVANVHRPIVAPYLQFIAGTSPNLCLMPVNLSSSPNALLSSSMCAWIHAQYFTLGSDQTWRVFNQCVQPLGGAAVTDQNLVLWPCNGGIAQRWQRSGNSLVSVANSNLCVDVTPAAGSGTVKLSSCASPNSAALLFVETSRSKDLAYDSGGYAPQFTGIGNLSTSVQNAAYPVYFSSEDEIVADGNLCMAVTDPLFTPNATVALLPCNGNITQKWTPYGVHITAKGAPNLCLDRRDPLLQIVDCASTTNGFVEHSVGYGMQLRPRGAMASNLSLCVQTNISAAQRGQNSTLSVCNQSNSQIYAFSSYAYGQPILLVSNLGDANYPYLAPVYTGSTVVTGQAVVSYYASDHYAGFYKWDVSNFAGGPGAQIWTAGNGGQLLMDASPSMFGGNLSLRYATVSSSIYVHEPRPVVIQASNATCLTAQSGNSFFNSSLTWTSCANSAAQKMFLPYTMGYPPSTTRTMPVTFNGLCLDANTTAGSPLTMAECNFSPSQYWRVGAGVSLSMVNNASFCVDANSAGQGNLASVQPCTGAANQNVSLIFF